MIDFEKAICIANEIEDLEWREYTLMLIARQMARMKLFKRSIEIAENLKDLSIRSQAFCYIGCELIKNGFWREGKELLDRMQIDEMDWEEIYYDIIDVLKGYEINDLVVDLLDVVLKKIGEDFTPTMISIAEDFMSLGFVDRCLKVVNEVLKAINELEDVEAKIDMLMDVSSIFLALGLKDKALDIFRNVSSLVETLEDNERDDVLDTLTVRLIDFYVRDKDILSFAVDFALRIIDRKIRNENLRYISERLSEMGYVEIALNLCDRIDDPDVRDEALSNVALQLAGNFDV